MEKIVFCAREWSVVGIAVVEKEEEPPYTVQRAKLEKAQEKFWKSFNRKPTITPERIVPYLEALIGREQAHYGKPDWGRVLELDADSKAADSATRPVHRRWARQ